MSDSLLPAAESTHGLCRRINETGPPLCSCTAGTCDVGNTPTAHALAARIAEGWQPPRDLGVVEPGSDEELELRGVWMSRLMFGGLVDMAEGRTYEQWLEAQGVCLA